MPSAKGFDNEKYLAEQSAEILKRVGQSDDKLYLEFGGKLIYDYHAARILPGFDPTVKIQLLQRLKDKAEIILCIYAGDIERRKIRADFGISYDMDVLKVIDDLRVRGLSVTAVVITRFDNQPSAGIFKNKLERLGIRVYTHRFTKGYPTDVDTIVSDEGYGANTWIETTRPLVIVTGPGPGSGKLATCLSQLYHDYKRGIRSGYAKFETFPIWNLPLRHPVNVAYEAATADLDDRNMIDSHHLAAYNVSTVNYNRDIEVFPVLRRILEKITGKASIYRSPTDMGVNRAGFAVTDDAVCREAANQEILRRYFRYSCEYMMGFSTKETIQRVQLIIQDLGIKPEDRKVVLPARRAAEEGKAEGKGHAGIYCGACLELRDGRLVTGKNSELLHAASSLVLNAVKTLADIPERIPLISVNILESIRQMNNNILNREKVSLDLDEALIALAISAATNPTAQMAVEKLKELRNCDAHITHIPTPGDEAGLRRLGVNLTSDPYFSSDRVFTG
jgi:uncharacterized protein (UPF0371 family)